MALVSVTHLATTTRSEIVRPAKQDYIDGKNVEINNEGSVTVYVGGDDLTASSGGTPIPAGEQWYLDNSGPTDRLYVITASGTANLSILWTRV